jgi:hypothetical protein
MTISDWKPFYKYTEDGAYGAMSQQTYEPLISPDGQTFCANYDWQNQYQRKWQPDRKGYTEEVVDYFFFKEVEYAHRFANRSWAPEIVEVDIANKRIFYKWYGPTCNEILYTGGTLPATWKADVHRMITDAYNSGVYKLTMYPHCCYYDDKGLFHTIDMYGCIQVDDPYIEAKYMDGIIHETAKFRLEETGELVSGNYNMEIMFKRSLGEHVKWGTENLNFVYKDIFNA